MAIWGFFFPSLGTRLPIPHTPNIFVYVFYTNPIILFYVHTSLKTGNNFKGKPSYKSLLTNEFPKLAPNYPIAILTTQIVALLNTGKLGSPIGSIDPHPNGSVSVNIQFDSY